MNVIGKTLGKMNCVIGKGNFFYESVDAVPLSRGVQVPMHQVCLNK